MGWLRNCTLSFQIAVAVGLAHFFFPALSMYYMALDRRLVIPAALKTASNMRSFVYEAFGIYSRGHLGWKMRLCNLSGFKVSTKVF